MQSSRTTPFCHMLVFAVDSSSCGHLGVIYSQKSQIIQQKYFQCSAFWPQPYLLSPLHTFLYSVLGSLHHGNTFAGDGRTSLIARDCGSRSFKSLNTYNEHTTSFASSLTKLGARAMCCLEYRFYKLLLLVLFPQCESSKYQQMCPEVSKEKEWRLEEFSGSTFQFEFPYKDMTLVLLASV